MPIGPLIRLVRVIQDMDTKVRESSLVGESEMDRQSRQLMAWICRGAIAVLGLIAFVPAFIRYLTWLFAEGS
jgi:hypothetical protein